MSAFFLVSCAASDLGGVFSPLSLVFCVFVSLFLLPDTSPGGFKHDCGETRQDPAPDPVVLLFSHTTMQRGRGATSEELTGHFCWNQSKVGSKTGICRIPVTPSCNNEPVRLQAAAWQQEPELAHEILLSDRLVFPFWVQTTSCFYVPP